MALDISDFPPQMMEDVLWMARRLDAPPGADVGYDIPDTRYRRLLHRLATELMDVMEKVLDEDG